MPLDSVVGVAASRGELQADVRRDVALGPVLADHVVPSLPAEKAQTLGWERGMHLPAAPSLRVFTSVAITTTLFLGLVIGLTFAEVLGDLSGAVRGFLLVTSSLSIALMTTVSLSMIFPHRSLASGYPVGALFWSYSPYLLGALAGIWSALWLGEILTLGSAPLAGLWKWIVALVAPVTWLGMGLLITHLVTALERRQEHDRNQDGVRESRHRIMIVHEQTRKEVAGLLHGRVQSRMVVLGHWIKQCQDRVKDGPREVVEGLENVSNLLQEIRDQELRSITRQLYPSIIRTGLPSALNSLTDRFRPMFDVHLEVSADIGALENPVRPSLNESLRLALYRVAEEALGNVAKHAQATQAWVSLSLSPVQNILVVVRDNGDGFDPATAYPGQGLLSMEDYVVGLGGTIEVDSRPGMGTTVKASVPLA